MAIKYNDFSPEHYKTKLYQKKPEFQSFSNIDDNKLEDLSKLLQRKQQLRNETTGLYTRRDKITEYIHTLIYLTNPQIHMEIKTYDERIAYLIMATDPELITFKEFLKTNITSLKQINSTEDEKEKAKLSRRRTDEILEYQANVRSQIGFYDSKLLRYEEIFFKKFYSTKQLLTNIGQKNISGLLSLSPFIKSFESVTDEEYQKVVYKVQEWLNIVQKEKDSLTAAYSITHQNDLLKLKTLQEQYIFFILATDPNLEMLKIYEEESMIPEFERRSNEAFGYSSLEMVRLESLYHERFCPEKKVSIWSQSK